MRIGTIHLSNYLRVPEARLHVYRSASHPTTTPHRHDFIEMVIILSGEATHFLDGNRYKLRQGDVFVLNKNQVHAYEKPRNLYLVNILIGESMLRELKHEFGALAGFRELFHTHIDKKRKKISAPLRLDKGDLLKVGEWINAMEEEEVGRPGVEVAGAIRCWFILIVIFLARHYGRRVAPPEMAKVRLERVFSWIENHFADSISIEDIAHAANMSKRSFFRHFHSATGLTPVEYLTRTRIQHACSLISDKMNDYSMTDIALQCGFQDSSYFSREFRKNMKMSPRSYKQLHQ